MEEAPVTAATGALGPVIAKLASLLGSEYKLRWRTRRDVKFVRSKLKPLHSILWNIWETEELDEASKALKMEALDLADDVDDTIVDFILSMERSLSTKLIVQTKIKASPFRDFKKRASDVSGRCHSKWKKKEKPAATYSRPSKPRAYPFVRKDASELVGIVEPRDEIIKYLVGKDETTPVELQLKMAFIYGTAGMGKTTLADLVYEAIGEEFQSRAFVSVTPPGGNMSEVLATILQQVAPNISVPLAGSKEATEEEHLIDIISNFLKDKRYLVVVDDIWNWREWEMIMKSFPENNLGSRIVGTTRITAVAEKWRHDPKIVLVHEMLPKWNGEEVSDMKTDLVAEGFDQKHPIVYMCGGTPLAVHCMLSAVEQEREKQAQKGIHAKESDVQDEIEKHVKEKAIQNTPGFEPLVESFQLGYDNLPHHMLKTCLLYCSLYPDGHVFEKDNLVRRWISEGFVYTEEEANGFFEELVNRGLILFVFGELRMQPMMRNFLIWKSRQDNFITHSSEITSSDTNNTSRIRRLCICKSLCKSSDTEADPFSSLDWNHIRSLIVCEGIDRIPFDKLEGVRVLDLRQVTGVLDHHLKDICGIVRLRHLLGLNGRKISGLPPEIVNLQCLETFEAKGGKFARLPGFIGNLQQLKTLELRGFQIEELPTEIGSLQQLENLHMRGSNISELPNEIGSLQKLKTLDISYTSLMQLPKVIEKLQQLKTLNINDTGIALLPKEIGSLQKLNTLNISSTPLKQVPKEIGKLHQLKTLDISLTNITSLPKEIGEMRHLEHVFMRHTWMAKIPREIGALKELKSLEFDENITALPLEVCLFVELPECIRQALNSGLVSKLAEEMLAFQKSLHEEKSDGGLVVGAKQMNIPLWIKQHFNDLVMLDIRICKLEDEGLKILREMSKLEELTLRFEVVPRKPVAISSQGFATLKYLTVDSRVPRVTFAEGAMPVLCVLRFQFQFYAGPPNKDRVGINHLRSLFMISFQCNEDWYGGGDSPCILSTIDVMMKEAREFSNLRAFYFTVCGESKKINSTALSPPHRFTKEQREIMCLMDMRMQEKTELQFKKKRSRFREH